jgi:predicted small lipoprotein YifL
MHNIKKAILTLLIATIFTSFCGCGQTGTLYLPQKQSPTTTTNQEKQSVASRS